MHLLYARFFTKAMADMRPGPRPRAVPAAVQPGPDPGRRRRADVEVARQRPGPRRAGRALRRGHRPAVPDVHGPVGPGRAVEPDRDRRRPSLPEPRLDAGPRPARARARRSRMPARLPAGETEADAPRPRSAPAAHRTLRDVTADYEGFRFNTMVAKLMELANTLFRYRGTAVAGDAEWDEAIRLLLLMLAPAAPHITEELWSRRAGRGRRAVASIHTRGLARGRPERRRRGDPRDPGPGQRQAARQGHRPDRRHDRRHRGGGPRSRADPDDPGRPGAGPDRRGRRRQARQPRHPVSTGEPADALAFDRYLDEKTPGGRRRRPSAPR